MRQVRRGRDLSDAPVADAYADGYLLRSVIRGSTAMTHFGELQPVAPSPVERELVQLSRLSLIQGGQLIRRKCTRPREETSLAAIVE
jgi:hypothetical protein